MDDRTPSTASRQVLRVRGADASNVDDDLVVEEPLEIRLGDRRFTVTMRTPGADLDLARGLLFTEGVIQAAGDVGQMRYCDSGEAGDTDFDNVLVVRLKSDVLVDGRQWQRTLMSGTSCGLCGKAALEAVTAIAGPVDGDGKVDAAILASMPETMRSRQPIFDRTGGLHAAAIFDANGECLALFEDIGRHNATDKAIGRGVNEGWLPWKQSAPATLLVSGRASFEITQKALMAAIPIVASVSAASTLAVDVALAGNMTLIGFLRGHGMTVYAGAQRIFTRAGANAPES